MWIKSPHDCCVFCDIYEVLDGNIYALIVDV